MQAHSAYAAIAITRARELPSRLAFGLFIALAAWSFTRGWAPAAWFVAMAALQLLDVAVTRRLRAHPEQEPSTAFKLTYSAIVFLNAVCYSGIAVYLWFEGGLMGKLFALLTPAGALLNVALSMERGPRGLLATWCPHIAYLIGLPLTYGMSSPGRDLLPALFVSAGGIIFVVHIVLAVRRIQQGSNKLRLALDEAQAERARAERASAAKSDFLATMSHEIRTPMNAVVAAADLLRRSSLSKSQAEHVEMLTHSSALLLGVLNDVLDLSKIESGKLKVVREPFALTDDLAAAVRLWGPKAGEKGLVLEFEQGDLPAVIMADPLRMQQIVFNLLSNAVKFTDAGRVRLRGGRIFTPEGPKLWIEVEDSGCGMSAEMCARVFNAFEQGSSGVTRTHGGSGLGLSISRRLAEMMGGCLTVTSVKGQGSVFRLETPLTEVEADARTIVEPASVDPDAPLEVELLLAEDHEINQRIVRLILEPLGCRVTVAQNGQEAVTLAQARPFDLILMDMQMPVMGGVEATSCIRMSGGPNAATPIMALTANVMDDHRAQWAAVGVDTLLPKPIDMAALIGSVRLATARGDAERQARAAVHA
jgi:two-component system, sensor histidine kinase